VRIHRSGGRFYRKILLRLKEKNFVGPKLKPCIKR